MLQAGTWQGRQLEQRQSRIQLQQDILLPGADAVAQQDNRYLLWNQAQAGNQKMQCPRHDDEVETSVTPWQPRLKLLETPIIQGPVEHGRVDDAGQFCVSPCAHGDRQVIAQGSATAIAAPLHAQQQPAQGLPIGYQQIHHRNKVLNRWSISGRLEPDMLLSGAAVSLRFLCRNSARRALFICKQDTGNG